MTWKLHSLMQEVGLEIPEGFSNPLIESVSCDSRQVKRGTLFLGIPGETVDGGLFWPQAFESGAVAAVIGVGAATLNPPAPHDAVIILEEPVAQWIGELLSVFWNRPSSKLCLIGVTGTNGKTTTTHLIEYLSKSVGNSSALFGTLVNRWPSHEETSINTTDGVDVIQEKLSSAVNAGVQLAAMEVSSHSLVQYRVAGCRFAGAIFTNLSQDHLDYHDSMEEYFKAKASLFNEPYFDSNDSRAVVNIDNKWGALLADQLHDRCWKCSLNDDYSNSEKPELYVSKLQITSNGVSGLLNTPVGMGCFRSPLVGNFNLMNLVQAVGCLIQQGIPLQEILDVAIDFPGVPGRMEKVALTNVDNISNMPLVIVDYAHTPDALKNVLLELRPFVRGKIICVFGCGGDRDRGKRAQMGAIASQMADCVIITSDNPRNEHPMKIIKDIMSGIPNSKKTIIEADRHDAIHLAVSSASTSDLVLIAGKGHENYQIIGNQKKFFDDRDSAQKALKAKINY